MVEVTVKFEDGFRDRNEADRASEIAKRITVAADEAAHRMASMLVGQFNQRTTETAKLLRAAHLALRESQDERTIAKKDEWVTQALANVEQALAVVTAKQRVESVGVGLAINSQTEAPEVRS